MCGIVVIIAYLSRPYRSDKYYVITEYINISCAVRDVFALSTAFKFFR